MSDATDAGSETNSRRLVGGLFALIAILIGVDVLEDFLSGVGWEHLALELGILVMAMLGAGLLWRQVLSSRETIKGLGADLERAREEAEVWHARASDLLRGLGEAIDEQFARWSLSGAERQVGLMLLKGLSLRDIAALRSTSERTVRQQAFAVYQKAGLGGRAELSAFFLEDLLLPLTEGQDRAGAEGPSHPARLGAGPGA